MIELTKYNTLSEALAFNLTAEDIETLGYIDIGREGHQNREGIKSIVNTNRKLLNHIAIPSENYNTMGYLGWGGSKGYFNWSKTNLSPYELEYQEDNLQGLFILLINGLKSVSVNSYRTSTYMKHSPNDFKIYPDSISETAGSATYKNGVLTYLHLGDTLCVNFQQICGTYSDTLFNGACYITYVPRFHLLLSRLKQTGATSFQYNPFSDFRWLENKKIFLANDFKATTGEECSIEKLANLIPEGSLFFICANANDKTTLETELPTMQESVATPEGLTALYNKFSYHTQIGYRSGSSIYVFMSAFGFNSLFYTDSGEDYPLDKSGYIDYSKLDFRKVYTKALGAAKIHPRVIQKLEAMQYLPVKAFTNKPDETQGKPYSVSISQQMFKSTSNKATLNVTLGYTTIEGVTYNDELGTISSANGFLSIVKVNDTTYTISFTKTTEVQADKLIIPIKNTFTNVWTDVYFELDFVADNQSELLRLRQEKYSVNLGNVSTINGYVYYERETALTQAELSALNDADKTKALAYLKANFIDFNTLPYEPIQLESLRASNNSIMYVFKGKSLSNRADLDKVGTYTYQFTTKVNNLSKPLVIEVFAPPSNSPITNDPNTGSPGNRGNGGGNSGSIGSGGRIPGVGNNNVNPNTGSLEKDGNYDNEPVGEEPSEPTSCILAPADEDGWVNLNDILDISKITIESDNGNPFIVPPNDTGVYGENESPGWRNYQGASISYVIPNPDNPPKVTGVVTNQSSNWMVRHKTLTVMVYAKQKVANTTGSLSNNKPSLIMSYSTSQPLQSCHCLGQDGNYKEVYGGADADWNTPDKFIEKKAVFDEYLSSSYLPNDFDLSVNWMGFNKNNPSDISNLKYKPFYFWEGLSEKTASVELANGLKLCLVYLPISREEWNNRFITPTKEIDFNSFTEEALNGAGMSKNTDGTYKTNYDSIRFDLGSTLNGKKLPYGNYSFEVNFTDTSGKTHKYTSNQNYTGNYIGFWTNLGSIDKNNIKTIDFKIIKFIDFTGVNVE